MTPTNELRPTVLDCTIRDGSYAIDFKFTAHDSAVVVGLLAEAGVRYVEVGHGLGLGASEAGKGTAASPDVEVIERARASAGASRVGAFFIPGIGSERDLREGAAAGLEFVRLGQDADRIDETWPFLELALELGLEPFLNLMKTYGIGESEFAACAREAAARGAAGIYVVDSAGGMLPGETRGYCRAAVEAADIPVGFHGHNNLHLAVANSLAALEVGATFVDTTLYGIGRSSGNVPTEVMAAVLDRLGIDCGLDTMRLIDAAEAAIRPLAESANPHDMLAVVLGYGRFHSSFLPRALAAADRAGVDPFRLVVELGRRNPMSLDDGLLEDTVAALSAEPPAGRPRADLAAFADDRFGPRRIRNRSGAVAELLSGLEVVAAKRGLGIVLDLVPAPALEDEPPTAEFVLTDSTMALGRVRFGSAAALAEALAPHAQRVALALLDLDSWDTGWLASVRAAVPALTIVPYSSAELQLDHLAAVAAAAASRMADEPRVLLADPGVYPARAVDRLAESLELVAPVVRAGSDPDVAADVLVVAGPHDSIVSEPSRHRVVVAVTRDDAYRERLPLWRATLAALPAPQQREVVAA